MEHYGAQGEYAEKLFIMLEIPWWKFLKRFKAYLAAEDVRTMHMDCCEWPYDDDF